MTRTCPWSPLAAAVVSMILSILSGPCFASEPAQQFLNGLRQRGYFDMALEYLDSAATSELAPTEFREILDLEKAITLVAGSRAERDSKAREQQLDKAQQLLAQFVAQHPDHWKANTARSQLGSLLTERARIQVEASKKGGGQPKLAAARKLYSDARKVFADHQATVRSELESIPKVLDRQDETQANLAERRNQLRADYLQTELLATAAIEETADTFDKGSKDYTRALEEAAAKYQEIYKKYRTRLAGLYARMYQGRSNQKMGKYRDALGFYVELLDQPDSPEQFRVLKTKTLRHAVDCWLSQKKYLEAIQRLSAWVATATPQEERNRDWLYLRLSLARAYMQQAKDEGSTNRVVMASQNEAEKQAKIVARYEGEFQREANLILGELGNRVASGNEAPIQSFAQARTAAKEKLDLTEPPRVLVAELKQQLRTADASLKSGLQQKLADAEEALGAAQEKALDACRLAFQLVDGDSPAEEVNLVRYYLAYLHYARGDFYDAALLGDFVARRHPNSLSARQCAEITMACYRELYSRAGDERQFEERQIIATAEYILDRWPDRPEAEAALATLIPFMLNAKQLDRARTYLDRLPDGSPRKGPSALKTGMAIWKRYLESAQSQDPDSQNLDELKASAYQILKQGADLLETDGPLDRTTATAILCLVQACLETGRTADAIGVLQDPRSGPLTLVRENHPATGADGFVEDTYKTALRAYISSLNTAQDGAAVIRTTRELMSEMTSAFGGGKEGQRKLVRVYVAIARELEEQLKVATPSARDTLSKGFETFLTQLSSGATELSVLNWVAETFSSLGAGFDSGPTLNPTAARYYDKSAEAFENLLARVNLEPGMRIQIQVRLAAVRRSMHKYEAAVEELSKVLSERNTALNVQIEAARTYQIWAATAERDEQEALYDRAMRGDFPDPATRRNTIWGWGRIANVTANLPQFRDAFHTARYNLSTCRLRLAEIKQGAERMRQLDMAEKDVSLTKRLYGLGNEGWTQRYDSLLKQIQRSKGEQPVGLRALDATGEG